MSSLHPPVARAPSTSLRPVVHGNSGFSQRPQLQEETAVGTGTVRQDGDRQTGRGTVRQGLTRLERKHLASKELPLLLIRPNQTVRKSPDPQLIWTPRGRGHALTLSSEEPSWRLP